MGLRDKIKNIFSSGAGEKEENVISEEVTVEEEISSSPKERPGRRKKKAEEGSGGSEEIEDREETSEKEKENKKEKKGPEVHRSELRDIVEHVINEEERTFSNYINPAFWQEKRRSYKKIRDKEKQGKTVYEVLYQGARPSMPYYILTILSCIIATAGLIQGSSATIIGAMIVAPLMTPILAFSLGVIWGDIYLIRTSLTSIFKGIMWAVVISTVISYLVPIPEYSPEILSRTHPTLFDVLVALASGIVGAYGYANEKISSTLVGIAIAVALMPPLCNIGIGIGTMNPQIAYGATVLFVINLVSIGLAGAVVFWMMEIHPPLADQEQVKKRAMYQIIISIAILLVISVPLSIFMVEGYQRSNAKETVRIVTLKEFPHLEIFKLEPLEEDGKFFIKLVLTGSEEPDKERISRLEADLTGSLSVCHGVRISFIKSLRLTGP